MKMTPSAFHLNFLGFYLVKYQKKEQFLNPQNKKISKLTLLFEFDEDLK